MKVKYSGELWCYVCHDKLRKEVGSNKEKDINRVSSCLLKHGKLIDAWNSKITFLKNCITSPGEYKPKWERLRTEEKPFEQL